MGTSEIVQRRGPRRLVPSAENGGTRLESLKTLAAKDWKRDPEVVVLEDALLEAIKEELRGEIRYHGAGTDLDLFEDMLNGKRQSFRARDLIRIIRNARISTKAGKAADRAIAMLAAMRGGAFIPLGSTNDRRHQPARRDKDRRRA